MNIFRQLIETDELGSFLADATHDNGLIQSIKVYPIEDDKVGDVLAYTIEDLPDLLEKMQANLTKTLG